jgi:hypothetical protein
LQLFIFNEEFLVSAVHQTALIMSLPFVHTARRSYRLNASVRVWESVKGVTSLCSNLLKSQRLEEGEVVTRFPLVNQRKDHFEVFWAASKPVQDYLKHYNERKGFLSPNNKNKKNQNRTTNIYFDGCLGSDDDEDRSEL